MSQPTDLNTDLRKLLSDTASYLRDHRNHAWPYVESGQQFQDMLDIASRIDAALAEVVEPVAWMHRSLTHPQYDGGIHPEKRDGWEHVPLYSSPVSGLRAGMLQAAFMVKDHYWDSLRKDQVVKAHIEGIVKAITKAADQAADTAPASQWRRVDDGLPTRGETVWVSNGVMACECHRYWNSRTRKEEWSHPFDDSDSPLWWTPLPALPEGDK